MDKYKRSLYVFSWQLLRVNLSFATVESTEDSIKEVSEYISSRGTRMRDIFKGINLYAATAMGLEGQLKKWKDDPRRVEDIETRLAMVREERNRISRPGITLSAQRIEDKETAYHIDNHDRWRELVDANGDDLLKVQRDLRQRWVQANKRPYQIHRPELAEYLFLLEVELVARGIKHLPSGVGSEHFMPYMQRSSK